MASDDINAITMNYEENGVQLVKELKKEVLSRGAWTTILFLYQELDRRTNVFTAPKASIRRYRKVSGQYRIQSKFTISGAKQARKITSILSQWFPDSSQGGKEESFPDAEEENGD